MRDNGLVTSPLRHLDGLSGFCKGTDLIHLDDDRVPNSCFDTARKKFGVSHKDVIADELYVLPEFPRQLLPPLPVVLCQAVLDTQNWVALDQALIPGDHIVSASVTSPLGGEPVAAVLA